MPVKIKTPNFTSSAGRNLSVNNTYSQSMQLFYPYRIIEVGWLCRLTANDGDSNRYHPLSRYAFIVSSIIVGWLHVLVGDAVRMNLLRDCHSSR